MEKKMFEARMKGLKKGQAVNYRGVNFVGSETTQVTQEWLDRATNPRIEYKAPPKARKAKDA
jgi:hypothetical protein